MPQAWVALRMFVQINDWIYRAQVLDLGGPDLTAEDQPTSEVIFEWNAS